VRKEKKEKTTYLVVIKDYKNDGTRVGKESNCKALYN
jgi:hypothetical protein